MPISNMVSMGPAVASRVRSLPPLVVIAATPLSAATLGLGHKLVKEGFDLVGEGIVGGGKRGVSGYEFLEDFSLVAALARLSRALLMESRRPGLWALAWAELAWPRLSSPPVARKQLALFLWAAR